MYRTLFLLFTLGLLHAQTVTVAVAANVSYAIKALVAQFNQTHPESKIRIVLGSSGALTAQITNNAPFDIFMSADMKYPETLFSTHNTVGKPVVYAKGALALFSVKKHDFTQGMQLLTDNNVNKIAIAQPEKAPYGKAAQEAMQNVDLYNKVTSKLVYAESIAQVVSYTMTATDMGFIAASSLFSPSLREYKEHENYMYVPANLYTPIEQGIVLLKRAEHNMHAQAFYTFILSKEAQEILKAYGYSF